MKRLTTQDGDCFVYVFKAGVLRAAGHDLKLRVDDFSAEVADDGASMSALFKADSLRVVCAMSNGQEQPGTLSRKDERDIEANIRDRVLQTRRHGEISFVSTSIEKAKEGAGMRIDVRGDLTLCGKRRAVETSLRLQGGRYRAELALHQPDFGIRPFSALMGTLRIQPKVVVRVEIDAQKLPS